MAVPSTAVWEVASGGLAGNGGGFDSAFIGTGTDWSQATGAHVTIDGTTITLTRTSSASIVQVVGYTVAATDVGNAVNLDNYNGGTGTAGTYFITAVNVGAGLWTLDRDPGTVGQTLTGRMGGCKSHPIDLIISTSPVVSGNTIWCKGNFTITATLGPMTGAVSVYVYGYVTTRGDGSSTNRTTWSTSGASLTQWSHNVTSATNWVVSDILFDGNGQTSPRGLSISAGTVTFVDCGFTRFTNNAATCSTAAEFHGCDFTANTTAAALLVTTVVHCQGCRFSANTFTCVNSSANGRFTAVDCEWFGNTGASTDCVSSSSNTGHVHLRNCTIDGGRYGLDTSGTTATVRIENCLITNCATNAIRSVAAVPTILIQTLRLYNCTVTGVPTAAQRDVSTLTGDPYYNLAGGDLRLNSTAGAGLSCQGTGYPTAINTFATGYNIGANGPAAAAGGLLTHPGMGGGARG